MYSANMILRTAKIADLEDILELFEDSIHELAAKDYDTSQREAWASSSKNRERWQEKIERQYFLLAEADQQLLGFASLEIPDYVDLLYVHPQAHGKGVARKLYEALLEKALEKQAQKLSVDASITARPFFEKCGFHVVNVQKVERQTVILKNYKMEIRLGLNRHASG
ncbi:GNAT family N-acetyltransferase [Marinilongibacter aquaticus]|uniref:GNAT family N-acetyltransferase n=1 Tax=Marinilongibacter aquaticus TaxID=2975157 RepID=UPI0021BCFE32|nr:GNAT family N-acetyltransferase [Marinilongibacter aquaticus]UBM58345.1 GNAT family N-acetyltransferase [Marinilongibacter aquaticus]